MKKFLSILLSVAMLMTILPATLGFAAGEFTGDPVAYSVATKQQTSKGVDYITYTWTYESGFEYASTLGFEITYNPECLTVYKLTPATGFTSTAEDKGSSYKGALFAADPVMVYDDFEEVAANIISIRFAIKSDAPANSLTGVKLLCSEYKCYVNEDTAYGFSDGATETISVPVTFEQPADIIINEQEIIEKSNDATLKSLKYGDTAIELVADKYTYDVELPYGVEAPALTAVASDEKATVAIEGNKVTVTAEDGETVKTYTINFTNAEPAVTGIKVNKESVEVPYANKDAVADYVKANIEVNYVTEAGDGEAVEVFEVEAAEGVATITVGEYTAEVAYEIADPLVTGIKVDKDAIEVPYANKDAVADYVKAHVAVNYVTEAGDGEAVEVFEVEAAEGVATITVGEYTAEVAYEIADPLVTGIKVDKDAIEVPYANKDAVADYVKANIAVNYVTEAGDGEAVEVFEVEAEDGVATVIVGEFTKTVEYTIAAKLYKLNVSAVNGTILATYEDKVDEDWDTSAVREFATGTNVTLKAVADEDAEFVYWMDATTKNVVYYGEEYAVVMGTDKNLLAVSAPVAEDVFTVEFTDFNNKVYVHTTSDVEITVPADPYVLGYTFEGWAIAGVKTEYIAGQVIPAGTFTADTKLKAIQTLDETKYAITLIGANEESGEYEYNKTVTVTPAVPEGKVFAYWKRDEKVVSYNETYKFFVANYPSTVEAVFEDEAPKAQPTITMAQPVLVGGNKISFMMERNVPEGYSVVEAGIIAKSGIVTEITLDNKDLIATSANTGAYGAFTVRKANVEVGESWSAAGYLIYTDGTEVYTIYTAPVSYTRQ